MVIKATIDKFVIDGKTYCIDCDPLCDMYGNDKGLYVLEVDDEE